ncbi:V-type ATPase subunit [Thermofilum pendens]|uniref:V-type ATP synthase subunit C n=1 Tax=Thermofilum pendens (strain DSM 2475 / Hrk 5) TaxID=368408 RepID=A1RX18_THEPD|nr:V-type ATPase subunit [Thermofilum pendens]ABL77748.1 hypothetical protein Tpen_0339 [Thermofilum pendens Hrk 5]
MEEYVAVRAHGLKSRLLSREDYEQIVEETRDISSYHEYSIINEKDTLEEKLDKIYRVYVSRITILAQSSSELAPFFYALLDRLEFENVKIQLRSILGYARPVIYYPYGRHVGPARLSGIRSEGALWDSLREAGIQGVEKLKFTTGLVAEREAFVDFLYIAHLMSQVRALRISSSAKDALLEALEEEAGYMLAYWSRVLGLENLHPFLRILGLQGVAPRELGTSGSTTDLLRQALEEVTRRVVKPLEKKFPVSLPYAYAFNHYARLEASNLEKILLGKSIGLPKEVILRNLVFYDSL